MAGYVHIRRLGELAPEAVKAQEDQEIDDGCLHIFKVKDITGNKHVIVVNDAILREVFNESGRALNEDNNEVKE